MQTFDRNVQTRHSPEGRTDSATRVAFASHGAFSKLLSPILVSSLLLIAGPVVLPAIAQASLISIQILLQLGRLGLAAFQVLSA